MNSMLLAGEGAISAMRNPTDEDGRERDAFRSLKAILTMVVENRRYGSRVFRPFRIPHANAACRIWTCFWSRTFGKCLQFIYHEICKGRSYMPCTICISDVLLAYSIINWHQGTCTSDPIYDPIYPTL